MAFDLGIGTSSFPQIRDNEIVYDTYYSIYPAAIFTLNLSDYFRTSLGLEHKKIYNSNPEGEESSASFNGGSVNISVGKEFNFIVQTSYFDGKDFKNNEVVDFNQMFNGLKLITDYLEKSILKPNNISHPKSRIDFLNIIKE